MDFTTDISTCSIALLVSDSPFRVELENLIQSLGCTVLSPKNPGEFHLHSFPENVPDLMVLEYGAIRNKDELYHLENGPCVPAIIVVETEEAGRDISAKLPIRSGILVKPIERSELKMRIEDLLHWREYEAKHHKTLKELEKSREKYKNLVENIPDVLYSLDDKVVLDEISIRGAHLFGYERGELLGKDFSSFIHPDDRERVFNSFLEAAATHREYTRGLQFRVITRSGEIRWVEINSHMHFDKYGNYKREEGVLRDIDDRKKAEIELDFYRQHLEHLVEERTEELNQAIEQLTKENQERRKKEAALRVSENRFREFTDILPTVVGEYDLNLKLTYVNKAGYETFGYTAEDFKNGVSITDLIHPDDMEATRARIKTLQRGEKPPAHELRAIRKDGSEIVGIVNPAPIFKDGRVIAIRLTFQDISEWKQAQIELQKSLDERDVLLKEIHHRVKNNMQVISSLLNLQAIKERDKSVVQALQTSRNRVSAMALVHESIYKSRNLSEVRLASYLEGLVRVLLQSFFIEGRKPKIEIDIPENIFLPIDQAIPCGLVLNELMTNSMKYAFTNDQQGEIRIAASKLPDGRLKLVIRDNGIGLPEDLDPEQSTTLGLSLVVKLVRGQLQGELDVEKKPGTSYTIILPNQNGHHDSGD